MKGCPDVVFFDLDDTLYPKDSGLWEEISRRIDLFLIEHIHLSPEQARASRARFASRFGTTLAGLMSERKLDPGLYLEFVHDIDLTEFIQPDARLIEMLERIEARTLVFTNASRLHAERVLAQLRIGEAFERIVAIEDLQFVNKPEPSAYARALRSAGAPRPDRCLILDDRLRNLIPAGDLGMMTAEIGSETNSAMFTPDFTLTTILDLPEEIPALFREKGSHGVRN